MRKQGSRTRRLGTNAILFIFCLLSIQHIPIMPFCPIGWVSLNSISLLHCCCGIPLRLCANTLRGPADIKGKHEKRFRHLQHFSLRTQAAESLTNAENCMDVHFYSYSLIVVYRYFFLNYIGYILTVSRRSCSFLISICCHWLRCIVLWRRNLSSRYTGKASSAGRRSGHPQFDDQLADSWMFFCERMVQHFWEKCIFAFMP